MKFAAFTEETIWGVGATEAEARTEAEATMRDMGDDARIAELRFAPIDDALVEALAEAEANGTEVLFELMDGELCEVEVVDA
jgi:hypothetical protein